ncbi:hypothetical protein AX14_012776 [Amanita brunnescens Koide BX004]|nr:hypothetical protein AX14_012776 [Amanita brunnescens Koide BX004]
MDPKSSRGQKTIPFEFGIRAPASQRSHPFEVMMTGFFPLYSPPMDPKSSRGRETQPSEFGTQALGSRHSHPFDAVMTGSILSNSRPTDPKSSQGQITKSFEFGMQALAAMDEPMIRGRLTSINTGRYMGALPDDVHFHCGKLRGSTYIGWTTGFKLVIVHFPEQ